MHSLAELGGLSYSTAYLTIFGLFNLPLVSKYLDLSLRVRLVHPLFIHLLYRSLNTFPVDMCLAIPLRLPSSSIFLLAFLATKDVHPMSSCTPPFGVFSLAPNAIVCQLPVDLFLRHVVPGSPCKKTAFPYVRSVIIASFQFRRTTSYILWFDNAICFITSEFRDSFPPTYF